jgi:hypothetical protein
MLWSMAFERVGVVVSDLYFLDPDPDPGQEGPERGVRLELRAFERDQLKGSIYSAVPIRVDRPLWRVDLLESVASEPGSLDRAHHHPRFNGWEPGPRVFVAGLSADPLGWLRDRFGSIENVLAGAGLGSESLGTRDVRNLSAAGSPVVAIVEQLLQEVCAEPAPEAPATTGELIRRSWL